MLQRGPFWAKETGEQWHSAGIVGKIPADHIDPHIREAGEVLDGVFRLGNPWETKGSSNINTVTDQLVLVTLSTIVFSLYVDAAVYTHANSLHVF